MELFKLWEKEVWVTSDTHFSHSNICSAVSNWPGGKGTRLFNSLHDMNKSLINGINFNVEFDDVLIHGGDWSFGGSDNIWKFRDQINCKNIYLTYGNHDHHIENNKRFDDGRKAKDLFTFTGDVLKFQVQRTPKHKPEVIFLSHYAHLVWDKSHHGNMHIFGHSHASINKACVGKSMDVGIDNAILELGEWRPFKMIEVLERLDKKQVHKLDHHDKTTSR